MLTYLGIPSLVKFENRVAIPKTGSELEECYCSLDMSDLKKILNGNVSPLNEALQVRPNNEVYVMFAIQVSENNDKYQTVLPFVFAKGKDTKYKDRFQNYINSNSQRMEKYLYSIDFKEYRETPTELPATGTDNNIDWPWS